MNLFHLDRMNLYHLISDLLVNTISIMDNEYTVYLVSTADYQNRHKNGFHRCPVVLPTIQPKYIQLIFKAMLS